MSEPKLTSAVSEAIEPPKTFLQKLLDGVERVGNKVPHPAGSRTCFIGWERLSLTRS